MEKTEQIKFWESEFGDEYTLRNSEDMDLLYQKNFGISRTKLNQEFLGELDPKSKILEIGCNQALQLVKLNEIGFCNLWGLEINQKALKIARNNLSFNLIFGTAFDIPFKNNFFDLVFTSGVLIHISPKDLPPAIDEMYRTSKRYIWCFEYFSEECQEISYRGHSNRLWKNNFLKLFLTRHPDLKIVKEKTIKYLDSDNRDIMFLLEKPAEIDKSVSENEENL